MSKKKKHTPGPDPDRLKLDGNWRDAVRKAVRKRRPKKGWPREKKKR
jgi:hypothetical protein